MIPTNVDEHVRALFTAWRSDPGYDGSCFIPRAEFYINGEMEAVVMFPTEEIHPLAQSLFEVTSTLAPLGDGIVVTVEAWVRTGDDFDEANYVHGDLARDASADQGLMLLKITSDTLDITLMPFGVEDDGTVNWGESIDMGGGEAGGRMTEVIAQARERSAALHAQLQAVLKQYSQLADEIGVEPVGIGTLCRGALEALMENRYLVAMSEGLRDMA